ncbi:MAG: WD40-repeat-containing domain protein [Benniella sp.]|nr:MAG: WD40-repeat-containing domain protein [Benniella sp.]
MVLGSIFPIRDGLSTRQALELASFYLDNARQTRDVKLASVLCDDAAVVLSQVKRNAKWARKYAEDQDLKEGIAEAYIVLGKLQEQLGHLEKAQSSQKTAEKWSDTVSLQSASHASELNGHQQERDEQHIVPQYIFAKNIPRSITEFTLPKVDEPLESTYQLVYCLRALQSSSDDNLDPSVISWLRTVEDYEQDRLHELAGGVLRAFKRAELKDDKAAAEAVYLAPVLTNDAFRDLLREYYSLIDHSGLLYPSQLEGLAHLIQSADPGYIDADDIVKILELLYSRLRDTHQQSSHYMSQLTLALSHVLDAMADVDVRDLDREKLHEPLSSYLGALKGDSDPYFVYQAAYAYQALLCIPDDETAWQSTTRRTGGVVKGVTSLVSAVRGLDLNKFINGLEDIQRGLGGSKVVEVNMKAYDNVTTLSESGQGFLDNLKEGFGFDRKRDWYSALRGADILIRDGELATFKELVCNAPCRLDPAFQWGVCQRLGEIAVNPKWDLDTRRNAIEFLGEIYREDAVWGKQPTVKQWILDILMRLASSSRDGFQLHAEFAEDQLQELESNGDEKKHALFQNCRQSGPSFYPLRISLPEFASPSLLDRAQENTGVEGNLRLLRKQRTDGWDNVVYIPPQAKPSLQAADDTRFPLMEKTKEFLEREQKVFLLLGEAGTGKSMFCRELEHDLWQSYEKGIGRIPLYINLSTIDKPEHDMIAKHLQKAEFTVSQIRELKLYRRFILICDGYDESQQTHNLYMSNRLNQPVEWDAQMVICCRIEYLGVDYRDRFQPCDRNLRLESSMFQEAVIMPFTFDQVREYIKQYVSVHKTFWDESEYIRALELIPGLKEMVKNLFLMRLLLDVLPRVVDPGVDLSTTRITRVTLYDHFIEHWLVRGRKQLEKDLTDQEKAAFESLCQEGFTEKAVDFMKRLSVAIYREQDGYPFVSYEGFIDKDTWKTAFFGPEEKTQLLLKVCPLTRAGNQYRFNHRSLLEYGLELAVFDPHLSKVTLSASPLTPRKNTNSPWNFKAAIGSENVKTVVEQPMNTSSPLVTRSFVMETSVVEFLSERVQQEPEFKQQLLSYLEHSKKDRRWRIAAVNSITILVRAGVQFIGFDLKGIQIPGADLSNGVFDSAQLQRADLRMVKLGGTWLRQADMSGARMTDAQFGELPFLTPGDEVRACSFSPDNKALAVGLGNGNISIYATSSWEKVFTLAGHTGAIGCVVYSPRGDQIASCSLDTTLLLATIGQYGYGIRTQVFAPKYYLVIGMRSDVSHVHQIASKSPREVQIALIMYSPKGDQLASGSLDTTVRLWDIKTGDCRQILTGHDDTIFSVVYSPDGDRIASGGLDETVRLWDVSRDATRIVSSDHIMAVNSVKCSPTGKLIASGGSDATIRLWDVETGACHKIVRGHTQSISSIVFSPREDRIASGCTDGTVRLWDTEAGTCLHVLTGHSDSVRCAAFSPQGHTVVSASDDKTVRLWNVETGECLRTLEGHSDRILSVACSPNSSQVATGSADKTARIWNAETGESLQTLESHSGWVGDVAFSPQGDQLASAGYDKTIRLWNLKAGECRTTLTGHEDKVRSIAYSHQGDLLASGSWDKTVRLWDVASGECRSVVENIPSAIHSVAWSTTPNAAFLVTGSGDGSVLKWKVQTEGEQYSVHLGWKTTSGTLAVTGASIQGVHGLTSVNKQLLKQRGAIGEPKNVLRDTIKRLLVMASVTSRLNPPSAATTVTDTPSMTNLPRERA